ncbi:MAG: M28 family peptidase [Ignavibacteria bacterium]
MLLIFSFNFLLIITNSFSQLIYNNKIDSIINLVSIPSISRFNKELTGDTLVTIGGITQVLYSRYWGSPCNSIVAQYIFEKFQSFGLVPEYIANNATNINVYAVKKGIRYPNKKFIIGAHYDDIINPEPGPYDTIQGADDNASGVCGVLEAARLLSNMSLDYTVIFVAFDEEEHGMYGSMGFADSCYLRGDTILGVLNLDMLGWDSNNDKKVNVITNINSSSLFDNFYRCNQLYQIGLNVVKDTLFGGCDHKYFCERGYRAVTVIEDMNNFNPFYHTKEDKFNKFNIPYFHNIVKASIATLLIWTTDSYFSIYHIQLLSGLDTSSRVVEMEMYYPNQVQVGSGSNAPRLYYKINNGSYIFTNAFEVNQKKYKFLIPGSPPGTKIFYYIAAQDVTGNYSITLPPGGNGINPPGINPPAVPFVYTVFAKKVYYSNTTPKPIIDYEITRDTIHISQSGMVKNVKLNLNINHINDGDLYICCFEPLFITSTTLCNHRGEGGQNFINTTFSDSAILSISQGSPPFLGVFKPEFPFENNVQMQGDWVLTIYDNKAGDQGTLLNWSVQIDYENIIGIKGANGIINNFILFQNYPNPFNPGTVIRFQIKDLRFTTLKVYNILGKEIATLVNEKLQPGTYEVKFEGTNLPSGVYYYKLETENYNETKKMVLIK